MKHLAPLLLLFIPGLLRSQPGGSDTSQAPPVASRPLPPSILAELRASYKAHALVFRDTVAAKDIAREHFNDTGLAFPDTGTGTFADSVISMIDTAVSLPQKEWLDSELLEIPELARFGDRVHFNYPPAIMVETNLNPVPFDSTLLAQMNPVIIEDLPFFDQSPIPMPLRPARNFESFLEAGVGNVNTPRISGWLSQALSERSAVDLLGQYQNLSPAASALHSYLNLHALFDAELGPDPGVTNFYSNDLSLRAGYSTRSLADTNTSTDDHTLSNFSASAAFHGDLSKGFHYAARFGDREVSDNYGSGASESTQELMLGGEFDLSSLRGQISGSYSRAAMNADTMQNSSFFGSTSLPIDAERLSALVGEQGTLEWNAGVEYLRGTDRAGVHSELLPAAHLRVPLNARWELGAAFEPNVQLASLAALTDVGPFYSPELVLRYRTNDTVPIDGRSVVVDKINLAAFMNYTLSPDDEIRFEARYITRDREPVFNVLTTSDSSNIFTVAPESTSQLSLTAAGNFLLFARDVLSGSAEFISTSISGQSRAIPFEPNFRFTAEYHLNSLWSNIQPSITFRTISRPDRTLTFLDLALRAEITKRLSGEVRAENILDGPSDFWPGYAEYPQSFWASLRYSF